MNANTDYLDLLASTETNQNLSPTERETHLQWSAEDDRAHAFTEEKHVTRRLLAHPEFEMDEYQTSAPGNAPCTPVSSETYAENGHDARKPVYGVVGSIPVRCISVKPSSPKSTGHAGVVTRKWLTQAEEVMSDD